MAVLEIRTNGDPVLHKKAVPVTKISKRIRKLIKDMIDTMKANDGVGLAAPQVGISEQLIVFDCGEGPKALINPMIIEKEDKLIDVEGCLSIPNTNGYVERARRVVAQGYSLNGPTQIEAEGLLSRILQHEIDHLAGILFIEKATGITKSTQGEDQQ